MSEGYETISVEFDDRGIATVALDRPERRNAFDDRVIRELQAVFNEIATHKGARLVVLRGKGSAFCAGADLEWMKASVELSFDENVAGAEEMSRMFEAIRDCPVPVVAVVHGHALGGGAGLVAAADVAIINEDAKIGFTEVRLGIVPAVISPFVLEKIGPAHARRYFVSGEVFDGREAARIGLAQRALPLSELESELDRFVESLLRAGPRATREAKRLVDAVAGRTPAEARDVTARLIADDEGFGGRARGDGGLLEQAAGPLGERRNRGRRRVLEYSHR